MHVSLNNFIGCCRSEGRLVYVFLCCVVFLCFASCQSFNEPNNNGRAENVEVVSQVEIGCDLSVCDMYFPEIVYGVVNHESDMIIPALASILAMSRADINYELEIEFILSYLYPELIAQNQDFYKGMDREVLDILLREYDKMLPYDWNDNRSLFSAQPMVSSQP